MVHVGNQVTFYHNDDKSRFFLGTIVGKILFNTFRNEIKFAKIKNVLPIYETINEGVELSHHSKI